MVLGLFGKPRFLDPDVEDWRLETWLWLMQEFGGAARFDRTPLVVPTREYFPPTETTGVERGSYIFTLVKQHMGMADWPCELEFFDRPEQLPASIASGLVRSNGAPSGTFQRRRSHAVIACASDLLEQPRQLITTFAHELAHYLLSTARTVAPGGAEVHELTTELAVAYAGFAVFGANHAFNFSQHGDAFSQGWKTSRSGYLSERTWAFNLVVFTRLINADIPFDKLKHSVAGLAKAAQRYFGRDAGELAAIRTIP